MSPDRKSDLTIKNSNVEISIGTSKTKVSKNEKRTSVKKPRKRAKPLYSQEAKDMIARVSKSSLYSNLKKGSKEEFYDEAARIIDILYENVLGERSHLVPKITPYEIHGICKSFLDAINSKDVRNLIKPTYINPATIKLGAAWQMLLYKNPATKTGKDQTNIKKKGLLKTGDVVKIDSYLPGGIGNYKVEIVGNAYDLTGAKFYYTGLRVEMNVDDIKKLFGEKDGTGRSVNELINKNEAGWFPFNIVKLYSHKVKIPYIHNASN